MSTDLLELSVAAAAAGMSIEEFTAAFIKLDLEVWIPQEGFMQVMLARVKQLRSEAIPETVSPPKEAVCGRTYSYREAQKLLKVKSRTFTELKLRCGIPRGCRNSPKITEEQLGRLRGALETVRAARGFKVVSQGAVFTTLRRCVKEFHVCAITLRGFSKELGVSIAHDGKLKGITEADYEKLKERVRIYKLNEES